MDINEVLQYTRNEMPYEECNKMISALMAAFDRIHPDKELVWIGLPKFDRTERKDILEYAFRQLMSETFDEETGEPVFPGSDQ